MIALPFRDRTSQNHLEQAGINAERQLAHYLCREFGEDQRVDLFFGLRLPLESSPKLSPTRGDAVQIDALLIHNHGMAIIESKSVHDEVRVTHRNEWSRTYRGKEHGMPSPVEQAHRQAEALRNFLQVNREELRRKQLFGMQQGGFKHCPIECFVAISDKGKIRRDDPDLAPEVMKADQISKRVKDRVDRHQKFGGFVGLLRQTLSKDESDDGGWDMTPEERGKVKELLLRQV